MLQRNKSPVEAVLYDIAHSRPVKGHHGFARRHCFGEHHTLRFGLRGKDENIQRVIRVDQLMPWQKPVRWSRSATPSEAAARRMSSSHGPAPTTRKHASG